MKTLYSKIKYFKKKLEMDNKKLLEEYNRLCDTKNTIYTVENEKIKFLKKQKEVIDNIFLSYSKYIYNLYKQISKTLDEASIFYEINKEQQHFMIYGKISLYKKINASIWYDYPGINLPFIHGVYNCSSEAITIYLKNNNQKEKVVLYPSEIFLNKPTDLLKFDLNNDLNLLEIYFSPVEFLQNNKPGVWIPA
jgi:hypothetical protein